MRNPLRYPERMRRALRPAVPSLDRVGRIVRRPRLPMPSWRGVRPRTVSSRVAVMVTAVVLAATGWLLLGSRVFGVRTVSISGAHQVAATEIRRSAGVSVGTPLALVPTGAIADRVRRLPAIADVRVRRSWPGEVRIEVVERTPILAVPRPDGFTLVDGTGVGFATVRAVSGLPIVRLAAPRPDDEATRAALAVLTALPARLRAAMARLDAPSPNSVTLVLRDGRTVLWGAPDDAATKARILAALLRQPGRTYDVSAPNVVTVRG